MGGQCRLGRASDTRVFRSKIRTRPADAPVDLLKVDIDAGHAQLVEALLAWRVPRLLQVEFAAFVPPDVSYDPPLGTDDGGGVWSRAPGPLSKWVEAPHSGFLSANILPRGSNAQDHC